MKVLEPVNGSKYLIVYHKEDNDGLFSMAIMYNYLVHSLGVEPDDITLFGATYNDLDNCNPDEWPYKYTSVIMTDISLKPAQMKKLYKVYNERFIWVDHHAPRIVECDREGLNEITGMRLVDRSAIMNMYEYLFNPFHLDYYDANTDLKVPYLLIVLSAYDSFTFDKWGFNKQFCIDVNTGCTNTFLLDPDAIIEFMRDYLYNEIYESVFDFENMNERYTKKFMLEGQWYNRIMDNRYKNLIEEYGDEFTVDKNRKGIALFIQGASNSMMFDSVKEKYQHGIVFKRLKDSKWTISLYNLNDEDKSFNCGEYLQKKYNGGGHMGAAGAQISDKDFAKILKDKNV